MVSATSSPSKASPAASPTDSPTSLDSKAEKEFEKAERESSSRKQGRGGGGGTARFGESGHLHEEGEETGCRQTLSVQGRRKRKSQFTLSRGAEAAVSRGLTRGGKDDDELQGGGR